MHDPALEPQLFMLALARETWRDEGIDILRRVLHQTEVSPPLRRTLVDKAACKTEGRPHTRRAVESEQRVSRTHEPVIMHGVELDRFPQSEDSRSSHR